MVALDGGNSVSPDCSISITTKWIVMQIGVRGLHRKLVSVFDVGGYQSDINPHLHVAEMKYFFFPLSNVVYLTTDLFIHVAK
jgi:hypothetical protein